MAIDVKVVCSDCGTVTDSVVSAGDAEILCPDCRRNMPNLPKEEFRQIESSLNSQRMMGIVAILLTLAAMVLLYFWAGPLGSWVSTDNKDYLSRNPREDTTMFFAAAAGCIVIAAILGALASRKRFVVEI